MHNISRTFCGTGRDKYSKALCWTCGTLLLLLWYGTRPYLFSPDEGLCYVFRSETIVASFLHFMVLIHKMFISHFSKCQFVGLRVAFLHLYLALFPAILQLGSKQDAKEK